MKTGNKFPSYKEKAAKVDQSQTKWLLVWKMWTWEEPWERENCERSCFTASLTRTEVSSTAVLHRYLSLSNEKRLELVFSSRGWKLMRLLLSFTGSFLQFIGNESCIRNKIRGPYDSFFPLNWCTSLFVHLLPLTSSSFFLLNHLFQSVLSETQDSEVRRRYFGRTEGVPSSLPCHFLTVLSFEKPFLSLNSFFRSVWILDSQTVLSSPLTLHFVPLSLLHLQLNCYSWVASHSFHLRRSARQSFLLSIHLRLQTFFDVISYLLSW